MRIACWPALLTGTHTRPTARPGPGGGRLKRGYIYLSLQTGIEASAALGVTVNLEPFEPAFGLDASMRPCFVLR